MPNISTQEFNTVNKPIAIVDINLVLEESEVNGVMKPKFDVIFVRSHEWKKCLSEIEESCAVKWNVYKSNVVGKKSRPRQRQRKLFAEIRKCHRSGTYESIAKERCIRKKSKKCNCEAELKIECMAKKPDVFVFTFRKNHVGHIPGDKVTDLRTLPLARRRLAEIRD